MQRLQRGPGGGGRRHRAQHAVRMAREVLGARLDREVHAPGMRLEEQGRGPAAVGQHGQALLVREGGQRRHVLHLHAQRARGFEVQRPRVGPQPMRQPRTEARREVAHLDAQAPQHAVAGMPHGAVDRIRDEHMIARGQAGQQRERAGRQPRGAQHRAGPAFELADGLLQRLGGRRAAPPVDVGLRPAQQVADGRAQHRGGPEQRRVDEAVVLRRVASCMDEARAQRRPGGRRVGDGRGGRRWAGRRCRRVKRGGRQRRGHGQRSQRHRHGHSSWRVHCCPCWR